MDGTQGTTEHWSTSYQHDSLATPEARESFTKTMSKFNTPDDVPISYYELQKTAGKPFKLPESLDKLQDENTRKALTEGVSKLYGVDLTAAKSLTADLISDESAFEGFNFAEGLQEGAAVDENLIGSFKQFAVENKIPKSVAQKMVGFYNQSMQQAKEAFADQQLEKAKATNAELVKRLGGEDKVKVESELVKRAFMKIAKDNNLQFEAAGVGLVESGLLGNPDSAQILMKMAAPFAKEDTSANGGGQGGATPSDKMAQFQKIKEMNPNSPGIVADAAKRLGIKI